ncbi:unnamed protein product (macronuclear) [Paramecium tetraurelia]|uniref:Uncharacterized protein n=1 Tax=Paramecium tetraurelia TaxID=5888 RepID=A0DSE5_PARTE|nr:uncharacterized protein GSPATT00019666001 [Paramecium tetraurelia]CAK85962.1 unnamed protein product [Paramecium tetraurelia]|eukprot:XP_001453359.1 hypothetical protein (macronuclear) [Paramecium tetraurelia strain d4-2]
MLNTSQTRSTNEIPNYVVIDNEYIIVKNIYKGNTYNLYIGRD